MPALPFFSVMPAQTASPSTAGSLTQQSSGQPASGLDSSSEANQFVASLPMNADGQSSSDTLPQGLSFWQTLQQTTELTDLSERQEFSALTPLIQEQVSTEENNDGQIPILTPLMTQIENVEESVIVEGALQPLTPSVDQAGKGVRADVQSPVTMDFIESQRTAAPTYQATNGEVLKPNQMQVAQQTGVVDPQPVLQSELLPNGKVSTMNGQQEVLPVSGGHPIIDDLSSPAVDSLPETKLGLSLKDLGLEEKPQTIHEKPITLQAADSGVKNAIPQIMETLQADAPEIDSLDGVNQTLQRDQVSSSKVNAQINENGKPHFKVNVPPQSPQWSEQIASRISIMSNEQVQSARIQLDPPELGLLEIKIKVQQDQVNVAFASGQQVVRDALETQAPRLKELMEQQGVDLGDVDVSDHGQEQMTQGEHQEEGSADGQAGEWAESDLDDNPQITSIETDSLIDDFA